MRPGYIDYDTQMGVVASSNDFRATHRMPGNISNYNEGDYTEYNNFGFTEGVNPTSVVIEVEWRWVGVAPTGVKFEVWEQETSTWHDETGITITSTDALQTRNITSYIDKANDVNNIKIRLLGYRNDSTSSDIEVDLLRVNVNSGATIRTPGGGTTSVFGIEYSDDIRIPFAGYPPTGAIDESRYQEYSNIGFNMPAGSVIGSVLITYEWRWARLTQGSSLKGPKLEIWEADNPGWNINNISLTAPAVNTDSSETKEVAGIIDTPNDINNLKFRFLAYQSATKEIGYAPDYISIKAKRKIIASDVPVYGPSAYTLYAGETDKLALDFKVPDNDTATDTLNAIYIKNAGTATNSVDIATVKLYADAGSTGYQGPPTDTLIGSFTWNGASQRWELSSLTTTIPPGGLRLFATVNIASNPTDARTIQIQIPVNGITVASKLGGPTDAAITKSYS
ncbi:MAG: hypothetical protein AB1546_10700, partial [bacterium]